MRKAVLLSCLILLVACDRAELAARNAVQQVKSTTRLPLDDQWKLCKARKVVSIDECLKEEGWIEISLMGYAKDSETASAFYDVVMNCKSQNNVGTRNYNYDGAMDCIAKAGWIEDPKEGWKRR